VPQGERVQSGQLLDGGGEGEFLLRHMGKEEGKRGIGVYGDTEGDRGRLKTQNKKKKKNPKPKQKTKPKPKNQLLGGVLFPGGGGENE